MANTRADALEWQRNRAVTDAEMARLINVSRATWVRYKNGICNLTAENEHALTAVIYENSETELLPILQTELEHLLGMFENQSIPRMLVWRRCQDLFGSYLFAGKLCRMPPEQQKQSGSERKRKGHVLIP